MCGIAGVASAAIGRVECETLVARIVARQTTRGPDALRVEMVGNAPPVVFGHNRLSIIDLSDAANQPFWSSDRRFVIAYNGEIFNYIELREELERDGVCFRTHSDTEVLLESFRRWGVDAFSRYVGMFAFSILDRETNTLYLARDRFGKKPFFCVSRNGTLAWASSSQELARYFGLQPSLEALARGIRYRVYDDEPPLYEGMVTLQPGHYLRLDLAALTTARPIQMPYYTLADAVSLRRGDLGGVDDVGAQSLVEKALRVSVTTRLRSDVPVGVSLSGGLDSSAVAAMATEAGSKIVGFSFGHPDALRSEGPIIDGLAKHLGIPVTYVWPSLDEAALCDLYLKVLDAQDGPFPTTSMMAQFLVYEAARSAGVKVILGGQGGDEAFMGYRKFHLLSIRDAWREGRIGAALATAAGVAYAMAHEGGNVKAYARALPRYLGRHPASAIRLPAVHLSLVGKRGGDASDRQIEEFSTFSLPSLLRYEDRNSMGNSVESRLPFMDHRLVELGIALPVKQKIRRGYGKWVLRKVMEHRLPAAITWARYKRGFDETQGWVSAGLGNSIRNLLEDLRAELTDILPASCSLAEAYSDRQLTENPQAFGEVASLVWLGRYRKGC